jgi:hypothetical protein
MIKSFLPKEFKFYDFFEQHIVLTEQASLELIIALNDISQLESQTIKVKELRKQMNEIHNKTMEAVILTFITPFERTDIHRLIKRLNEIGKSIVSSMLLLDVYELKEVKPELLKIAELLRDSIKQLHIAIFQLRDMKNLDKIKAACEVVNNLEDEADDIFKHAVADLYKSNDAIYVLKWREVLSKLEKATDRCKLSATIIESIMISFA